MTPGPRGTGIVADAAIPHLEAAFGPGVRRVRGDEIRVDHVRDAHTLLVRSVTHVGAQLVEGSALRFVGSATAGRDHVDLGALTSRGITFAHAPGCNAQAVVEYVLAATLGDRPLAGPVGIVGFGHIGRRLTHALRRLGYSVQVCDPPRAAEGCGDEPYQPLEQLLEACPTLSLHVPRVEAGPYATRHLIDAAALQALQPGSLLINTSRGNVVDNAALEAWLAEGRGAAIVDVWEGEPHLRASLLRQPGLRLATPHIAGSTVEGKARGTASVHEAYCRFLGAPLSFRETDVTGPRHRRRLACEDSVPSVLTHARPLGPIHAATIELLSLSASQRPAAFEALRRSYPLRHELSAFAPTPGAAGLWSAPLSNLDPL